jgi:transposase InsO family protein
MYTGWGARKLHAWLVRRAPGSGSFHIRLADIPSPSTIGAILRREGLTRPQKKRPRTPPMTQPFHETTGPNATWCVDFKGHFRTQDGTKCYPLTIMDAYSRKLLRCVGLRDPNGKMVRGIFESAFLEFGLPGALRSNNGPPFASPAPGGLSGLSVWWIQLAFGMSGSSQASRNRMVATSECTELSKRRRRLRLRHYGNSKECSISLLRTTTPSGRTKRWEDKRRTMFMLHHQGVYHPSSCVWSIQQTVRFDAFSPVAWLSWQTDARFPPAKHLPVSTSHSAGSQK